MTRALRVLYWVAPAAFCLALYWIGIRIWFEKDDFAWLNLRNHVYDFKSFWDMMFRPFAQGTIRPLSERGFFMLFSTLFGLRALPYRLFIFVNQLLNVVLVMLVARKLTKSELAGFLAPFFWLACEALVIPMSWTSSYNEIQWTSFLLASFYLFIRYTETGERKYYWAQWVTFVLGFGSLEVNVVYPALAAGYALLFAKRYFRSTLPMFGVAIVYAVVDRMVAPSTKGNFYYEMNFQPRELLKTFAIYWNILLGVPNYVRLNNLPGWMGHTAVYVLTAALLGFVAWQTWKRRFLPAFLLAWFLIVLGPLLPLNHHITEYYVMVPAIGIAILAAYGVSLARERGWGPTAIALVLMLLYLLPSTRAIQAEMRANFNGADRVRALVQSVAYAKKIHPGKMILLRNVDDDLFWAAVYDSPFRVLGWNDVFLTQDCRPLIHEDPHFLSIESYFLPAASIARVLNENAAVVYTVEERHLRNVTRPYSVMVDSQGPPALANSINVGAPYFKDQLGEGWYGPEDNFRWAKGHAVVYLPGPTAPGQKLYVHGYAAESQFKAGPLHVALSVDGRAQPVQALDKPQTEFRLEYPLPDDLVGKPKIEISFTVDRTTQVGGDPRQLGLAFGEFSIR